jgi:hypothetical protein
MKKPKPTKHETVLDRITAQLHTLLKRATKDVIEIGDLLLNSRACLEAVHGEWQLWLAENFDLSYRTALRYCKAAEYVERKKGKSDTVSLFANLSPTVLYALAEDRYSEVAEKAILAAARKGRVDQTRAEEIREKADAEDESEADTDDREDGDKDKDEDEEDGDKAAAEAAAIIDGPPPEVLPSAPIQKPTNFALSNFDYAVTVLKQLYTKPLAQFAGTAHSIEDLEKVEAFIRDVIQARRPL